MTYGTCPLCGSIPVLPEEFRTLHLAARPVTILNYLYATVHGKVPIKEIATHLKISQATLSVHISRIRHEFRLCDLKWRIDYRSPSWYVLTRSAPHDEDNSAKRSKTPHS